MRALVPFDLPTKSVKKKTRRQSKRLSEIEGESDDETEDNTGDDEVREHKTIKKTISGRKYGSMSLRQAVVVTRERVDGYENDGSEELATNDDDSDFLA